MIWTKEQEERICETEEHRSFMKPGTGMTRIIAPNGVEIASLPPDVEGICYADIDLEAAIPGRYLIDTAGHYSTPGFLRLTFDKSVHKAVNIVGNSDPQTISYDEIQFPEEKNKAC